MIEYSSHSDFHNGNAEITIGGSIAEISDLKQCIRYLNDANKEIKSIYSNHPDYYADELYYFSGDGRYSNASSFIDVGRGNAKKYLNDKYGIRHFAALYEDIKIIFSGPCTILFINGEKTVVRCEGEGFSYDKGAMMAFLKYALPKDQWNRLLDGFHDSTQTLRSMIKILYGEDVYDKLMKAVKDGRANDKDSNRYGY